MCEKANTNKYNCGAFELNEKNEIVSLIDDNIPPIRIEKDNTDGSSESRYADTRTVLHLLNRMADDNSSLHKSEYYYSLLMKSYLKNRQLMERNEELEQENKELKDKVEDLYENDRILRKHMSAMSLNYQGITVKRELFEEVMKILKENGADDLYNELNTTSIATGVNGC